MNNKLSKILKNLNKNNPGELIEISQLYFEMNKFEKGKYYATLARKAMQKKRKIKPEHMKNQKTLIFLLILFVISCIFACKKDESIPDNNPTNPNTASYDTIFPLDYFPAFPGSYWKYVDSNNDTTLIKTDSSYQKDYYTIGSAAYVSDTFFVPIYNQIPIWAYEAHTGPISNSGSYPLTMILSDSLPIGSNWIIYNWSGTQVSRKIIVKDTTITISSNPYYPTIAVEEYYSYGPPNYIWIAKRYYTKNIGLIREDSYNSIDSTINTKQIIDYFINN
ncbi:MAG: hypothetical protein IPM86_15770 [Saprospiraceae bacterium]|nr:hypothetical protein [Saprospiraceae bacterium]